MGDVSCKERVPVFVRKPVTQEVLAERVVRLGADSPAGAFYAEALHESIAGMVHSQAKKYASTSASRPPGSAWPSRSCERPRACWACIASSA